jgi:hypothetical protein
VSIRVSRFADRAAGRTALIVDAYVRRSSPIAPCAAAARLDSNIELALREDLSEEGLSGEVSGDALGGSSMTLLSIEMMSSRSISFVLYNSESLSSAGSKCTDDASVRGESSEYLQETRGTTEGARESKRG